MIKHKFCKNRCFKDSNIHFKYCYCEHSQLVVLHNLHKMNFEEIPKKLFEKRQEIIQYRINYLTLKEVLNG